VPRPTGAEATGEGLRGAGGQGAGAKGKSGRGHRSRGAEAPVPSLTLGKLAAQEVGAVPHLPLPKPSEDLQVAKATTEPSGAVPGSSPLFQPDPAPPAPVESRPFARQPDPEGTIPPGPFQTARTSSSHHLKNRLRLRSHGAASPASGPRAWKPRRCQDRRTRWRPGESRAAGPVAPPFENGRKGAEAQGAAGKQGSRGENENKPAEAGAPRGEGGKLAGVTEQKS
jgi:hypothetical protein